LALFDLERLKCFKGPHGNRIGNNATGGQSLYRREPTQNERAGMSVSYGRFQTAKQWLCERPPDRTTFLARWLFTQPAERMAEKHHPADDTNGAPDVRPRF